MSGKRTREKSLQRRSDKEGKVVPLRDSALYRPLPRKGVTLTFGLDEVAGQLVIRYPDGTFERLGVSLDDLKT